MKDIQDLLDELEDAVYNRRTFEISRIRNSIDLWLIQNSVKEDLSDWIVDNFNAIEEEVSKRIRDYSKEKLMRGERFVLSNIVDQHELANQITDDLKQGLLNVVATFGGKC